MIRVALPYPDKVLWPNGRTKQPAFKRRLQEKHKGWAMAETWAQGRQPFTHGPKIAVKLIVGAKPKGPLPDQDNCVSASKYYIDGIAAALKINDRLFSAPVVEFSEKRDSTFVFEVDLIHSHDEKCVCQPFPTGAAGIGCAGEDGVGALNPRPEQHGQIGWHDV